jgi:hypothetical protein
MLSACAGVSLEGGADGRLTRAQQEFVVVSPVPGYQAWWLRTEFRPFGTEVRGIPVGQIRSTWCKATEFRRELFPKELDADIADASFTVDGNFDRSGMAQSALVGVYETCAGERGSFLLVLASPSNATPVVRFVHEWPGDRQFTVISRRRDNSIEVSHCMDCDDLSTLKWSRSQRRFTWLRAENG